MRFLIASPFVIVLMVVTGGGAELAAAALQTIVAILLSACIGYGIGDTMHARGAASGGTQPVSPTAMALWLAVSAGGGILLLGEAAGWALLAGGVRAPIHRDRLAGCRARLRVLISMLCSGSSSLWGRGRRESASACSATNVAFCRINDSNAR